MKWTETTYLWIYEFLFMDPKFKYVFKKSNLTWNILIALKQNIKDIEILVEF